MHSISTPRVTRRAVGLWVLCGWFPALGASAELLRVNVDDGNPPFMYGRGTEAEGIYPAILRAVFREMGMQGRIEPKPWRRALAELADGRAGLAGLYKTHERLAKFDYSDVLFVEKLDVYVRQDRAFTFATLDDLKGKRLGVISGWSYGDAFDDARRAGAFVAEEVATDAQNFLKLQAGRLDAVVAIAEAAQPLLPAHARVRRAGTLAENPTYLAFARSSDRRGLLQRFNAALSRLRDSGELARIVAAELPQR
jgi:polar amino acid transport system substrate-binding protein